MKTTVTMSSSGRMTLPAETRRAMGLTEETEFEVEISEGEDVIRLRPLVSIPREDAWAYTPAHLAKLERAREDVEAGRVYRLSEADLRTLADVDS